MTNNNQDDKPMTEHKDLLAGSEQFLAALPKHKASLHITHNQHLGYYLTAEDYIAEEINREFMRHDEWPKGEMEKAIEKNDIWEIQWYPDTPVGFYKVYASTLSAALKFIAEQND